MSLRDNQLSCQKALALSSRRDNHHPRRDRQNDHPDCRRLPIQIVALQLAAQLRRPSTLSATSPSRRLRPVEGEISTPPPRGSGARPAQMSADKARQKISPSPGALVLACRRRRPGGLEERRPGRSLAGRLPFGLPAAAVALLAGGATEHLIGPPWHEDVLATGANLASACSSPGSSLALVGRGALGHLEHGSPKWGEETSIAHRGRGQRGRLRVFAGSEANPSRAAEGFRGGIDARQAAILVASHRPSPPETAALTASDLAWLRLTLAGRPCLRLFARDFASPPRNLQAPARNGPAPRVEGVDQKERSPPQVG